jgi:hypothetical protein
MKLSTAVCMAFALLLAACGGGSNSSPTPLVGPGAGSTIQSVSGTLLIGNPGTTVTSTTRAPAFVSSSTKHVALFIDGAATTAGQVSSCSATTGTGAGCTITWAAQLTVPAAHTFAVEADSGTNAPANTVLSVGSGSYAIVAGTANALGALSLNGIASQATFTVGLCTGVSPNSGCPGTITISAPANNAIAYTGAVAVPTTGNLPTSGNVFDNGPATFVSTAPATGTITGTPGGGATADTILTAPELAGLTPVVSLPAAGLTVAGTPVTFTCTAGNITSTGGTLPVN